MPAAEERPVFVNRMFARIAPTYDLMNRLMTFGQDQGWRRKLLDAAAIPPHGNLLDIGTGTGDIAYSAIRRQPGVQAIGSDFTYEMMAAGVGKVPGLVVPFVQGDTFALPFPDETFDAVVSGFLVRNVVDRVASLLGVVISAVMVWYAVRMLLDSREAGSLVMKALVFPEWWLFVPVPLGFALLGLECGRRVLNPSGLTEETGEGSAAAGGGHA